VKKDTVKPRILIVEDNEDTRHLLKMMLFSNHFDIIEAEDGKKGFNLAVSEDVDVILLDMLLPGLRGFDFVKLLRNRGVNTPIVGVSNLKDRKLVKYLMSIGIDDYIAKPIVRETLLEKLNYFIEGMEREKAAELQFGHAIKKAGALLDVEASLVAIDETGLVFRTNFLPLAGSTFFVSNKLLDEIGINRQDVEVIDVEFLDDTENKYRYIIKTRYISPPDKGFLRKWIMGKTKG
jgi:CheY-like chemotaxis protein